MILAAGLGTRLGTLSQQRPKPMMPVCDRPLVGWAAAYAAEHGIERGVVNLHYRGEQIERELGDGSAYGVSLSYSHERGEILGTGGGIKKMAGAMPRETFVVLNAKIVSDLDLGAALAFHRERGAVATMVLYEVPDAERWGAIGVDPEGRVTRLVNATRGDDDDGERLDAMFTGVHIVEPELVERIDDGPCCVIRTAYRRLFDAEAPLYGYVHRGYFHEHSTPGRYLAGNFNLLGGELAPRGAPERLRGVSPEAEVAGSAEVDEACLVTRGARVGAGARLGARVVVGAGAEVAEGAELDDCVVWPGARAEGKLRHCVITGAGTLDVDPARINASRDERR